MGIYSAMKFYLVDESGDDCLFTIRLVDDLRHSDHITLVVADWHREHNFGFISSLCVDLAVESCVSVSIGDVYRFFGCGNGSGDSDSEWDADLVGIRSLDGVFQDCRWRKREFIYYYA